MDIMVTGGTGFIGSRLVNELISQGNKIHLLCRSSSDVSDFSGRDVKIFRGDITDPTAVSECLEGCEVVYHLAAYAKNWAKENSTYFEYNSNALKNILRSSIRLKVRRVLFMSTSVTFGPSDKYALNENTIRTTPPLTIYEASKIEAERTVLDFLDNDIEIITVNPTRLYGPGKLTEGNSVSRMIELYLKGKFRFIPGDGTAAGNYAFINDVVSGCIKAMGKGKKGSRYILGGENLTYNKFFSLLKETSGREYRMFKIPYPVSLIYSYAEQFAAEHSSHYPAITPGWVKTFSKSWIFSSEKAVNELGYCITPFRKGLQETLNWLMPEDLETGEGNEIIKFA